MMHILIAMLFLFGNTLAINAQHEEKCFQTWNQPEYQEWAKPAPGGYVLFIICKNEDKYWVSKAQLKIKKKGLPDFKVLEREIVTLEEAFKLLEQWKLE